MAMPTVPQQLGGASNVQGGSMSQQNLNSIVRTTISLFWLGVALFMAHFVRHRALCCIYYVAVLFAVIDGHVGQAMKSPAMECKRMRRLKGVLTDDAGVATGVA